jgi:hypothetical protein
MLRQSPLLSLHPPMLPLILAASPALACKDILALFVRSPVLRSRGRACFGMVWGRIGWYTGALGARQAPVVRS